MAKRKRNNKKRKQRSEGPSAPEPINFGQVLQQSTEAAGQQAREQTEQAIANYPRMEELQLGTIQRLANNLDNQYTRDSRDAVNTALSQREPLTNLANRFGGLGQTFSDAALAQYSAGPTALENQIRGLGSSAMDVRANQIVAPTNIREVRGERASFVQGPLAERARAVNNVTAAQVGAGQLGSALMGRAMQGVANQGRLSAEADRDAVQSARQGMAARGMATGNAALGAELLNRDRYRRTREFEDLGFAQGVQAQDTQRQFSNVANQLAAAQGNQDVSARLSMSDQAAINQARALGYQGSIEQIQAQAARNQQAALANQQRDQSLAAMNMDAQTSNQAANMQQLASNRAFMLDANQAFNQGTIQRRDQAAQYAQLGAGLLGQSGAMRGAAADLGISGAGALANLDPYQRAIGGGVQIGGGNIMPNQMQALGQTYQNVMGLGGDIASFNTNMQASMYNSYQNNQAALRAARMQSGALGQQGMMGMVGGIGGGALMGVGLAL